MMETEAHVISPAAKPAINETVVIILLAAINFTHILDFVIMAPLNPVLKSVFFISTREFSFLVSAYTLSAGVSGIISSFFIDRFDRKTALIGLYAGFMISNLCCALAPDYIIFLICRVIAGFFGGILGALIFSIIGDVVPPERRGRATGLVMAAFSAASVIGVPLGLALANNFSWNAPFMMITGVSGVVLVFCFIFFPSLTSHITAIKTPPLENIISVLRTPNLQWGLFFTVILTMAGFTVVPFISDYLVANVGLDKKTELPLVYLFGGLATVVSGPIVGRLADKFGKQKVFVVAGIISVIPMLLIVNLPPVSTAVALVCTTIFFIFFGARFVPAMALITGSVGHKQRGSFMSINSSVQQLSSAVGVFGAGMIISNTVTGELVNFNIVGALAAVATIACVLISYKIKQVS